MGAPSQRRALGALFLVLTFSFAGIAYAAAHAEEWIILAAAAVIGVWLAGLAVRGLRAR